ncbi:MAG: hypothetical protein B6D36_01090 [Planctomycetes bacterium UTPLA1]|jgi:hypothetical protein|nr:MAG: hypothetical protein B6D36_01090 [Planctomycetes bacterium UTPLA1]
MKVLITYCPEMNIYKVVVPGKPDRLIQEDDLAPGARFADLAPVFHEAKSAVESGRAAMGIHVNI